MVIQLLIAIGLLLEALSASAPKWSTFMRIMAAICAGVAIVLLLLGSSALR